MYMYMCSFASLRFRERCVIPMNVPCILCVLSNAWVLYNEPSFFQLVPVPVGSPIPSSVPRWLHLSGNLSLIHISEPTRQAEISYAVFCLKKNSMH